MQNLLRITNTIPLAGDPVSVGSILVAILPFLIPYLFQILTEWRRDAATREKLREAESKSEKEPENSKYAWDVARVTLESYFNKNLSQVSQIFWLSVLVMFIGFGIIIWGITQAIQQPNSSLPAVITGLAGVITELIGATFLFIYRSTIQQAATYTKTLERINSVGMAMAILDMIPNNVKDNNLKHSTRAAVVKMLMQQAYELKEDNPIEKEPT